MTEKTFLCPRCEFPLVPVHANERGQRKTIALTCPEPYCDHMQMLAPGERKTSGGLTARLGSIRPLSGAG